MIILASQSPRRRELLSLITKEFTVVPSGADEDSGVKDPHNYVCGLAKRKAEDVFGRHPKSAVIGADTIVFTGGEKLGKPRDKADAERMIRLLAGKWHEVYTGVALFYGERAIWQACKTRVWFAQMSDAEIRSYIETEDVMDKAGAYAIQGGAAKYITGIEGDFFNVVGLPVRMLYEMLAYLEVPL